MKKQNNLKLMITKGILAVAFTAVHCVVCFILKGLTVNLHTKAELRRLKGEISWLEVESLSKVSFIANLIFGAVAGLCIVLFIISIIKYIKGSSKKMQLLESTK